MKIALFALLVLGIGTFSASAKPRAGEGASPTTAPVEQNEDASPSEETMRENMDRAYAQLRKSQAEAATRPANPQSQIIELKGVVAFLRQQNEELKQENALLLAKLINAERRTTDAPAIPAAQQQTVKDGDLAIGMTLDQAEKSTHFANAQLISDDGNGTQIYRWMKTFPPNGSGSVFTGKFGWAAGMVTVTVQNGQVTSYQNDPAQ
jgi:TolA-binding protein